MTAYLRKKRVFSTVLSLFLALISLFSCFTIAACDFGGSTRLTGDGGVFIEGGDFAAGAALKARFLDEESEAYGSVLGAIEAQDYDKAQPVYVLELSVEKDGEKVQPNGKVKVTVPFETNLKDYFVLHLKDDGKIEKLSLTYKSGKATFQTDGFSKFAFVKKASSGSEGSEGGNGSRREIHFLGGIENVHGHGRRRFGAGRKRGIYMRCRSNRSRGRAIYGAGALLSEIRVFGLVRSKRYADFRRRFPHVHRERQYDRVCAVRLRNGRFGVGSRRIRRGLQLSKR